MTKCEICKKRKEYLAILKKKFNKDVQYSLAECVVDMGIDFLYTNITKKCFCNNQDKEDDICHDCGGSGVIITDKLYIEDIKECPKCQSVLATKGVNFAQSKHIHLCEKCGYKSKEFENL